MNVNKIKLSNIMWRYIVCKDGCTILVIEEPICLRMIDMYYMNRYGSIFKDINKL